MFSRKLKNMSQQSQAPSSSYRMAFEHFEGDPVEVYRVEITLDTGDKSKLLRWVDRSNLERFQAQGRVISFRRFVECPGDSND